MNKELSKKIFRIIGEYLLISIGTVLYCMAWEWFVVPNGYSSGGVTGLCILLQYATEGAIPVSVSFLVINAVLLLLAFLILGRGFGIKTIYCPVHPALRPDDQMPVHVLYGGRSALSG